MATPPLFTYPVSRDYNGADAARLLKKDLAEQDRYTVASFVDNPEQLLLTAACQTRAGGLRFSALAFNQLCRLLSPGLLNVVTDLAGLRRVKDENAHGLYSLNDALHIFNMLVSRRFRAVIEGLQLIRDTRSGTIEGVVGHAYQRMPNIELFTRAEDVLRTLKRTVVFNNASIVGRNLSFSYLSDSLLFEADLGKEVDGFHDGFYYSNSEVGDGSVRLTLALFRARDGGRALWPFTRGSRIAHAGKKFQRRLEKLISRFTDRPLDAEDVKRRVLSLAARPMGFTGDDDTDELKFMDTVNRFMSKQVSKDMAGKILRGVVTQGSFDEVPIGKVDYVPIDYRVSRSHYDLFTSILRVAKSLPLYKRERFEQMAYHLLHGRFTLDRGQK